MKVWRPSQVRLVRERSRLLPPAGGWRGSARGRRAWMDLRHRGASFCGECSIREAGGCMEGRFQGSVGWVQGHVEGASWCLMVLC